VAVVALKMAENLQMDLLLLSRRDSIVKVVVVVVVVGVGVVVVEGPFGLNGPSLEEERILAADGSLEVAEVGVIGLEQSVVVEFLAALQN
jgi:hypothetical protein